MTKARDVMHLGVECIREDETLSTAAERMRELQVGAMPICGEDDRLRGILTDRDIVVRCIAEGGDPTVVTAGELARGTPIWVDADADHREVLQVMQEHKIRRLPVLEDRRLVGIISEADVATQLPEPEYASFVKEVYSAPPNN